MALSSMTVSTSVIMFLLYIVMGFVAGLPFAAETFAGGSPQVSNTSPYAEPDDAHFLAVGTEVLF